MNERAVKEPGMERPQAGGAGRRATARSFAGAILLCALAVPAAAQQAPAGMAQRVVKVPAAAVPWDTRINPKFNFGMHNGRPPVIVFDPNLRPGIKVRFAVSGSTTTEQSGYRIPSEGLKEFPTRGQPEFGWPRFPSRYFASTDKESYLNGVVGAFVDADGRIVGKPFPIGAEAQHVVPDGASALALGLDDDNFSDNSGTLTVILVMPQPKVTVE